MYKIILIFVLRFEIRLLLLSIELSRWINHIFDQTFHVCSNSSNNSFTLFSSYSISQILARFISIHPEQKIGRSKPLNHSC